MTTKPAQNGKSFFQPLYINGLQRQKKGPWELPTTVLMEIEQSPQCGYIVQQ
jgi:hypothetical protein